MADDPETMGGEAETSEEATAGSLGAWDDLPTGFTGNPKGKLDERGRLKLPGSLKTFIEKKYGEKFNAFYITSRDGMSAEIYPMPEWQQHFAKVLKMPKSMPARKKLLDRYSLFGDRVDMDPQGRLQLPDELRNAGLVNVEVKIIGEGALLRVVALQSLRETVKSNPLTDADTDALTGFDV